MKTYIKYSAAAAAGYTPPVNIGDVFSPSIYTGNYVVLSTLSQTIVNGVNLSNSDGLICFSNRDTIGNRLLPDTERGTDNFLIPNEDNSNASVSGVLLSFNINGFTVGDSNLNSLGDDYISWSYRNAPRFFSVTQVTKLAGSSKVINLISLGVIGMVRVKRTDNIGSWYTWHRSLTSGKLLIGDTTAQETTIGQITVSGVTLTLEDGVIDDGEYHIEAYAHDPLDDGVIQCGSFTTDGSGGATIEHGWAEGVQYSLFKAIDAAGDWEVYDTARTPDWTGLDARIILNSTAIEDTVDRLSGTGTTLSISNLSATTKYLYKIIRGS